MSRPVRSAYTGSVASDRASFEWICFDHRFNQWFQEQRVDIPVKVVEGGGVVMRNIRISVRLAQDSRARNRCWPIHSDTQERPQDWRIHTHRAHSRRFA